jgi:hypothetical protein
LQFRYDARLTRAFSKLRLRDVEEHKPGYSNWTFGSFSLLGRSFRLAIIAALSARAAVAIELPIVRVVPEKFGYGSSLDNDNPRAEWCIIGSLVFFNVGRTQAFPIEVQCGWIVGDKLPDVPSYTFTKSFPINLIFESNPKATEALNINEFELTFAPGLYDGVRNSTVGMWFYCNVVYLDFMQNRHEAGFCWRRYETVGSGWFRQDATPAYNRKT